jgi:hypothetical protein
VVRDYVTTNPLTVYLQSSSPSRLTVPLSVTIPGGAAAVDFPLIAEDNLTVDLPTSAIVTASSAGFSSGAASVTILDNDTPNVILTLAQTNISEGAGPQATVGTVTRFPVSGAEVVVGLQSSDPSRVLVPPVISIPANQISATFFVSAVDNTNADGSHDVMLTPSVLTGTNGSVVTVGAPVTLTVLDDDGPALKVAVAKKLVPEGQNPATTGTVSRNTPATNALTVSLTSSDTNEAVVPLSVTILQGQSAASFNIASINDGVTDGNKTVAITASAVGFTSGSDTLVVSDVNLPDLVVTDISGPTNIDTEAYFNVSYRVANQGVAPAGTNFITRIFLSSDPVVGNDTLIAQYTFNGSIPPGQSFAQTLQVLAPSTAGKYWLIASTDVGDSVAEVLEDNNTTVSAVPVNVVAAYGARIQADLHSAVAGTPVPMHGHATNSLGGAAPFKLVNIHIGLRGTLRIISALTDANGDFVTTWQPLQNEAGHYTLGADYAGAATTAVQDQFTLYGFKAEPASPSLTVADQASAGGVILLENQSEVALTGMSASILSKPANVTVDLILNTNVLTGNATNMLGYTVTANDASTTGGTVLARVTSAEGASVDIPFQVTVQALRPVLVATPNTLYAGMARGKQAFVEFDVSNQGSAPSGPITVSLADAPWLSLASTNPMASLAPGESNHVTLQLMPAATLTLGPYGGSLALSASNSSLAVPFNFQCLSESKGDLLISAVDEFTYYAAGAPRVTNAAVTIADATTKQVVTNAFTDEQGEFFAAGLPENYYEISLTATNHSGYRGTFLVVAGKTNALDAFLSRQLVQYVWTVTPTTIEDRTRITIQTVFETVVPAPVVTIEPALIDLADIAADQTQIDLKISNHGLVAANNFKLSFPEHPLWEFTPLIQDVGVLPANSTLVIPLTIRKISTAARAQKKAPDSGPCSVAASGCWTLLCGSKDNQYCAGIQIINANSGCGGGGGGGGPIGGGPVGGGGAFVINPTFAPISVCDCKYIPRVCLGAEIGMDLNELLQQMASKLLSKVPGLRVESAELSFTVSGQLCSCCTNNQLSWESEAEVKASASITVAGGPGISGDVSWSAPGWANISVSGNALLGVRGKLSGEISGTLKRLCGGGVSLCFGGNVGLDVFAGGAFDGSASAKFIADQVTYSGQVHGQAGLEGSLSISVSGCVGEDPKFEFCGSLYSRLNASGQLSAPGFGDESFSANADVPLWDSGCEPGGAALVGIKNPKPPGGGPVTDPIDTSRILKSDSDVLSQLGIQTQHEGVCAHVRLQLDQDLVMARDAFNATLELANNDTVPLTNVEVVIEPRDASGNLQTNLFAVLQPTLSALSAVDGTGVLPAQSQGNASWILVPTADAAPAQPTVYAIGGHLSFTENDQVVTVPLSPVNVTVYPSPSLTVQYFHQRDVFSDDPFTDVVEPSIPFSLGVMVRNKGNGVAKNVSIVSAQPQIVDNESGLLIDFKIIATEVAGQNLVPSLTANFGDINPGQIGIGRWLLTSTLQGLFIDYQATFQHSDALGGLKTSLIDDLSIHEMIHLVQAAGTFEDGKPDFLVNDVPDIRHLPDTLYLSDGTTNLVAVVTNGTVIGALSASSLVVTQTAAMPPGWVYLLVPDPGNGQYTLTRVVRSDGAQIYIGTNAWTTDRTFIGQEQRPIRENMLHLLDYNSSGSYALYYAAPAPADNTAPTSTVAALPPESYPAFTVSWTGADDPGGSGLSFFDIYASDNGGPFLPWLQRTALRSAQYLGTFGHSYAFYSRATDLSGNVEPAPTAPEASTTVTKTNSAPVFGALGTQTINEGQTLILDLPVTDPENDRLNFSFVGSAPIGMTVNPSTGRITWPTTEATGPSTNDVVVLATDSGFPPLSATGSVRIVVNEVNSAPILSLVTNRTINEGTLLAITNVAMDFDIPANTLTFGIGPGAPPGVAMNPATGVFTWTPSSTQGPSTNLITIFVYDNGSPVLGATQQFTIVVRDTLPDFALAIGRTNVFAGESNAVPVVLNSTLDLTNITFQLGADETRLSDLSLLPAAAEVTSSTLVPVGSGNYSAALGLNPNLQTANTRVLANLGFVAVSNLHSAVPKITVNSLTGQRTTGQLVPNTYETDGRVVIVAREPVLDIAPGPLLTLFGHPTANYVFQYRTNLNDAPWQEFARLSLDSRTAQISNAPAFGPESFYRAYEFSSFELGLASTSGSLYGLTLRGQPGVSYRLQTSTNLGPPFWSDLFTITLTNSVESFNWTNPGEARRFFRAVSP